MNPNLHNGEKMIEVKHQGIKRFDIVTLIAPDENDTLYIKRIIGLPGEVVSYKNGVLVIDGRTYSEPYLQKYTNKLTDHLPLTLNAMGESNFSFGKIPPKKYLVLGDNRRVSKDGRYFGFIDQDSIRGKVIFKLWD